MHKPRAANSTPPFRPIVSSIETYNYNLAKFLSNLLQPHIPSEYVASDTFTFVREINDLSMEGKFMVSFDVESLFTNIPLSECIDLAVDYITKGNPGIKLNSSDLKRLFLFATAETHFIFKGTYYDQVDGVAMGSPLAPVLANLFMGHHEKIWLEQYRDSQEYVGEKVEDLLNQVTNLAEFASSQPQASYAAFTFGLRHRWTYFLRTLIRKRNNA
ncbi:uncharacterized protein LOC144648271 [Oculina patagonica]